MKDHNIVDHETRHKINYTLPPLPSIFEQPATTERKDMSPISMSKRISSNGLTVSKPFEFNTSKRARIDSAAFSEENTDKIKEYEPLSKTLERNF